VVEGLDVSAGRMRLGKLHVWEADLNDCRNAAFDSSMNSDPRRRGMKEGLLAESMRYNQGKELGSQSALHSHPDCNYHH
jgi:hypothetical protein